MKLQKNTFYKHYLSLLIVLLSSSFLMGGNLDLIKEKSFTVNPNQIIVVKTDLGDIKTNTWDKNEVLIKIFGNNNAEKSMEFSFDQDEKGVEIIGEKEGGFLSGWFRNINLKYEITVPENFNLEYKTAGGDISLKNISGKFNFKTSGGDISLENSNGKLISKTSGGDITIKNFTGDLEVATSGGDIKIYSENGKVNATTSGGDILLNYSGKNSGIKLVTSGGDIDVKVPAALNAEVKLVTSGGDISSDLSNFRKTKITKSKLIGTLNSGGEILTCKTSGGDITVKEK